MDFKDTLIDSLELLLVVMFIEPMIISRSRWLESHVDFLVRPFPAAIPIPPRSSTSQPSAHDTQR